jgi:hypothetical protein
MGTGRLLRCIGTGGTALAVVLLWLTTYLPWGAGDGIVTGYGFEAHLGGPDQLRGMLYLGFRYLSGYWMLPMVLGSLLALTAGVRSRPGRLSVGVLLLLAIAVVGLIGVMSVIAPQSRADARAMTGGYVSMGLELLGYLLTAVAAIVLMAGRWRAYGWYAVFLLVGFAVLHAASLADYSAQRAHPLRVEVLAWLPSLWYLGAAAAAALALTGSVARDTGVRRARHAMPAWQDRGTWTGTPANGTPTRTGR